MDRNCIHMRDVPANAVAGAEDGREIDDGAKRFNERANDVDWSYIKHRTDGKRREGSEWIVYIAFFLLKKGGGIETCLYSR